MPTISFSFTDEEHAAIAATVTSMTPQAWLEMNARVHVADCVQKTNARRAMDAGLTPAIFVAGLDPDMVEVILIQHEEKVTIEKAAKAAIEASVVSPIENIVINP